MKSIISLDKQGNEKIIGQYDLFSTNDNSYHHILDLNKKFGLINQKGDIILSCEFDNIYPTIKDDLVLVKKNGLFGFYNKEYLIYGIYAKPYILELDLINFITKLGLIISIIYFFIYLNLYYLVLKVKNQKNKEIYFAMFLCLIGLLIYSVGQSFHQGYLYWIYFSVFYSFLFLELKLQK